MKQIYATVILILLFFQCIAQDYRFNKITSNDGLSQSEVYSFLKDRNGFIWIGTIDGLNRYDGYKIQKYNTNINDSNSLSNNMIRSLEEDRFGRIWIGTENGLNVLNPNNQKITQVKLPFPKTPFARVYHIFADGDLLWVSCSQGLLKISLKEVNYIGDISNDIQIINSIGNINLRNRTVSKTSKLSNGNYLVCAKNSFASFNYDSTKARMKAIKLNSYFNNIDADQFIEDKQNNIWMTNSKDGIKLGLIRYSLKTNEITSFLKDNKSGSLTSNEISSLAVDVSGNIWIGTLDKGLNKVSAGDVSKKTVNFENFRNNIYESNSLNSNLVFSLYASNNNFLWIGTIGSGVNILNINQKKISHYSILPLSNEKTNNSKFIRSIYVDESNKIWIGTHNNGLLIYDRKTDLYQKVGFGTQIISHISPYAKNRIMLCTSNGFFLSTSANSFSKIEEISSACQYVTQSSANIYWICSIIGLYRLEIIGDKVKDLKLYSTTTKPAISFSNCRIVQYDKFNNEIWLGTQGGGLNILQLDKNQFPIKNTIYTKSRSSESVSNNYIRSIYQQDKNTFWIGTFEGLNKVVRNNVTSAQTFSHYFLADGLPNNLINSILEDDEHQLWLGTNGGLVKFDSKTIKSNLYNASDGMQSNEFSEHTCFKTADGEMFFGGMNGITSFYPQNLKTSSTKSEVTITDFYLFNEEVKPNIEIKGHIILKQPVFLTTQINLRPDENYFKLEFSAMNFNSPHKIKYAYKLEGYDKKWNITDANNRNATYTNLSHGDYTFLVKATNEDNLWSEAIRKINIHIATPFYLTWYAFLFYIISILLIMFYFTRYSIIRIATKQQIIHETEHNKVLHELDMIRTRFFINISHDLRTPLTLIVGPLEQILKDTNLPIEFKSQIGMVHRNGSKLKYLIEQLLDFRKQEAGKLIVNLRKVELNKFIKDEVDHFDFIIKEKGLDLLYDFKSESFITSIDTEKTSKVIFNLLSNAVKYTMSGYIEITIDKTQQEDKKNRYIIISVKDTGIGIERSKLNHIFDRFYNSSDNAMDSSYGIGLSHCKDLVEVMNGKIEVESDLGNGSIFTVFLPISETLDNESISVEQIEFKNKTRQELEQRTETQSLGQKKLYTILVAEDNPEMRLYIKSCLINDYNVLEAENGADGFQLAMNKNPDLIISDYIMPIMNGMEFCKKIKTTLDTSHIPVILLTARADNELKLEGLENGADDYITKPFDIDYLRIKVMNLINNRENLRNLFQNSLVFEPTKITINSMDEKFLNTLKLEIEKGVPDFNFSIDSLEKTMAMSHSKFYSKVKSLTGLSCKELLQDFRLKRAAQIILESDFGVADISYMVGFSDPKYFTSCFKAKFNTTPTKYRISNDSPDKVM